jgi:hypothetical protein
VHLIDDLDSELKDGCTLFNPNETTEFAEKLGGSDYLTSDVIGFIGQFRKPKKNWPRATRDAITDEHLVITRMYLTDMHLPAPMNLSATYLWGFVFRDVTFADIDMRNAVWRGCALGAVEFRDCDLTGAVLQVYGVDRRLVGPGGTLKISGGTQKNLTINGLSYDDWLKGSSMNADTAIHSARKKLKQI